MNLARAWDEVEGIVTARWRARSAFVTEQNGCERVVERKVTGG